MKNVQLILISVFFLGFSACMGVKKKADFEFQSAAYQKAVPLYKELLAQEPEEAKRHLFMIGQCYRLSNRPEKASEFYKKAIDSENGLLQSKESETLYYYYGHTLKSQGLYEEAGAAFQAYLESAFSSRFAKKAEREIENLKLVEAIKSFESLTTINTCEDLNSANSDFSPAIRNGKLVFSSTRAAEKIYGGTGTGYYDIFEVKGTDGEAHEGTATAFGEIINLEGIHDASATFTPDGKMMVFARSGKGKKNNDDKEVSLYYSMQDESTGTWAEPTLISNLSSDDWDGCPSFSPDGKKLYFSSKRSGDLDIYVANVGAAGQFGSARPVSDKINTRGAEMFPSVTADGKIFFASNGHPGLGGLDIFVFEDDTVRNVGEPLNSMYDDFGLMYKNDSSGYFVSNREGDGAVGDDDIYAFTNDSLNMRFVTYYLRGKTYSKPYDSDKRSNLGGVTLEFLNGSGSLLTSVTSDRNGSFLFDTALVINKNYSIKLYKDGYLRKNVRYSTRGRGVDESKLTEKHTKIFFDTLLVLTEDFLKTPNKKNPKDALPPEIEILYDLDSDKLRDESKAKLDQFVKFLTEYLKVYPDVKIEMGSHTDSRGGRDYNRDLAQRRANSAVKYVIEKGVDKSRIIAKGYGEDELKVKNAKTEEEHQANRRTTIKVIK